MENNTTKFRYGIGRVNQFIHTHALVVAAVIVVVAIVGGILAYRSYTDSAWSRATDYYRRADYDKAASILNHMPMPSDPDRLGIYAQTMLATKQLDKSAAAYQSLYEKNKDPFAKLVLGNVYNEQKKYDDAVKVYRELIKANPNYTQAYVNLATLYKLQGNTKDAIAVAKEGVDHNPNNTVLLELLVSLTMDNKNSDDYKNAVETLKKVNPQDPLLLEILKP